VCELIQKLKKMQKMKKKKSLLFICAPREFSGPFPKMTHWMEREGEKRGGEREEE
jgi:hypothetical protein